MSFEIEDARCIRDSGVDQDSEVYKLGTEGKLIVADWFAEKKGWL